MLAQRSSGSYRGTGERHPPRQRVDRRQARPGASDHQRRRSRLRDRRRRSWLRPRQVHRRLYHRGESDQGRGSRAVFDATADGSRREFSQSGQRREADVAPRVKELEAVLMAFREGTHCEAAVWGSSDGRSTPTIIARSSPKVQMPDLLTEEPGQSVPTNFGTQLVTRVPSTKKIWLTVGPCDPSFSPEERHIKLLMPVVTQFTDRKSTRLNSSHSSISYAVFCLKKKKNPKPI